MQLKFYARRDAKASYPDQFLIPGMPKRYIGRGFVPAQSVLGQAPIPASHPASREPDSFEAGTREADRAAQFCRDGDLWPADEATAACCGVEFVPVEFTDGEWVEAQPKPTRTASRTPKE